MAGLLHALIPRRALAFIRAEGLLPPGSSCLVACSGGPDSTALFRILEGLSGPRRWKLALAHVNYRLRGRASEGDEAFVRRLGLEQGVPVHVLQAPRAPSGTNFQGWARNLRYGWFADLARQEGFDAAATAHSADDQAETFLARLARGAGPEGLSGIRPLLDYQGLLLIRPLLVLERQSLQAYLKALNQGFRRDASNSKNLYQRNRLRKLLDRAAPGDRDLSARLARSALLAGEISRWMDEELTSRFGERPLALPLAALRKAPRPLARAALRRLALDSGAREESLDFAKLEAGLGLLDPGSPARSSLPLSGGLVFRRKGGLIRVS